MAGWPSYYTDVNDFFFVFGKFCNLQPVKFNTAVTVICTIKFSLGTRPSKNLRNGSGKWGGVHVEWGKMCLPWGRNCMNGV